MVSDSSSLIDGDIAEKLVGWDHSFFIFLAVLLGGWPEMKVDKPSSALKK